VVQQAALLVVPQLRVLLWLAFRWVWPPQLPPLWQWLLLQPITTALQARQVHVNFCSL
jgi:hypothetical protein